MFVPPLWEDKAFIQNTAILSLSHGDSNATGTATLSSTGGTSTKVMASFCSTGKYVFLSPQSAAAASASAFAVAGNGSFTIVASSSTSTSRTFGWICLG